MEAVIALVILGALIFFLLLVLEPPSPQQRANETKRQMKREKELGVAEVDAATEAYRKQVCELLAQASRQMVQEEAKEARRHAQEVVAQAEKEK
jgi:hypothetical protein